MAMRIADLAAHHGCSHRDLIFARWSRIAKSLTREQRERLSDPSALVEEPELTALSSGFYPEWFPPNRSVTRWGVRNFKPFGATQSFPLRHINIVVGPNSSGKSSLLESLLWAGHAEKTGDLDVHEPALAKGSVDLGGFENTVFRHAGAGEMTFSFDLHPRVLQNEADLYAPLTITLAIRLVSLHGGRRPSKGRSAIKRKPRRRPEVASYCVESDGRKLLSARRLSGTDRLKVEFCDLTHPVFTAFFRSNWDTKPDDSFAQEQLVLVQRLLELCLEEQGLKVRGINVEMAFPQKNVAKHLDNLIGRCKPEVRAALSKCRSFMIRSFHRDIPRFPRYVLGQLGSYLDSMRYLGPGLRPDCESSFAALLERSELRSDINRFLARLKMDFRLAARQRPNRVKALEIVDLRNRTVVSRAAAGASFNHLVSLFVQFLQGAKDNAHKTILIEQAFQQLHPAVQAEMGDIMIENALGGQQNQFIVETQSEHLILRLLRRIRQSAENDPSYPAGLPRITPEDVSVIYAQPTTRGTILRHLRISPEGRFLDDWPKGFFTERLQELL